MIQSLYIKNYAIIDELRMQFSDQLTIITGETGAGKSILLGALGLILGNRADLGVLRDNQQKCIIEGVFQIGPYDLASFFREHDLDYSKECYIRREIIPSGKSRAFVNDSPVNLRILQDLAATLVDIHQQFDTLDIHEVNYQLRILDALAGQKKKVEAFHTGYRALQNLRNQLKRQEDQLHEALQEQEFLQFQLNELEEVDIKPGEETALENELKLLENTESIKRVLNTVAQQLGSAEGSVVQVLTFLQREMNALRGIRTEIDELATRIDSALIELEDLEREAESLGEDVEFEPQRQEEVEERLNQIFQLITKHRVQTSEELLSYQNEITEKLAATETMDADLDSLKSSIAEAEDKLWKQAREIRTAREKTIQPFTKKVSEMLGQLGMPHARLDVNLDPSEVLTPSGIDEVRFLFAANKGSKLKPLKDVASGGEMSRLALCIKSLVADAIPLPTLIFDEIDTGISGEVARKMGHILKELASRHQVMSITHTPQIAVCADTHYFVYKEVAGEQTVTQVRSLEPNDRVEAIAIMLSGDPPTASAIENARELLGS